MKEERSIDGERLFINWYREQARVFFTERVRRYSKTLNLFPTGLKITGARGRYGSCSYANSLNFSWRLIMAPIEVIDYVVVHELTHIKVKNHSKRFWDLLELFMPDYRIHLQWLKDNRHVMANL